jgi:hypothetical protein
MLYPINHKELEKLEQHNIPINKMMTLEKVGSIIVVEEEKQSIIAQLSNIEEYTDEAFLTLKKEIESQLEPLRLRLFMDSFVASLYRNATIETNELLVIKDEKYSK